MDYSVVFISGVTSGDQKIAVQLCGRLNKIFTNLIGIRNQVLCTNSKRLASRLSLPKYVYKMKFSKK